MRRANYWRLVVGALAVLAVVLPVAGMTQTRLGTLQGLYALGLLALLVRLIWLARGRGVAPGLEGASCSRSTHS